MQVASQESIAMIFERLSAIGKYRDRIQEDSSQDHEDFGEAQDVAQKKPPMRPQTLRRSRRPTLPRTYYTQIESRKRCVSSQLLEVHHREISLLFSVAMTRYDVGSVEGVVQDSRKSHPLVGCRKSNGRSPPRKPHGT